MTLATLPEISADAAVASLLQEACEPPYVFPRTERKAGDAGLLPDAFAASDAWRSFSRTVQDAWRRNDYVVVRGLPVLAEGTSLMLASLALPGWFKTYRGGGVVKTFRMSPWTTGLSHSLRDGEFHTDLSTDSAPPAVTCIQCITPDPGAPQYGENRVARLTDLLAHLEAQGQPHLRRFLCETQVSMVNDRSEFVWSGTLVDGESIRFHPETLRAASRRSMGDASEMETYLTAIHGAACAVSVPFWLDSGDLLFVSNHRTLHYRGECSVIFTDFPLEFRSRSIHLLHKVDEAI